MDVSTYIDFDANKNQINFREEKILNLNVLWFFYEYFVASTLTSPASILKYFGRIFLKF